MTRLHEVDDDDGRHGEHTCGANSFHDAARDQLLSRLTRGGHDIADEMESDARQVSRFAPYGMRDMGEDELEGCLGEEIASGDGEDKDLADMEVFCDIL